MDWDWVWVEMTKSNTKINQAKQKIDDINTTTPIETFGNHNDQACIAAQTYILEEKEMKKINTIISHPIPHMGRP